MRLTRPRRTIRFRVSLAAMAATSLMLGVASVSIVTIQRQSLTAGVDEALRQRADNLAPLTPGLKSFPGEGDLEDSFVQLLDRRGNLLASSPNVSDRPAVTIYGSSLSRSNIRTLKLSLPAGRFRVLVRPAEVGGERVALVLGKNLDDVTAGTHVLIVSLAVASPVLALLLGLLAWWLTGRTLRPVTVIRREVEGIYGGDLDRRVPVPDTDDEIAELARTMNEMLGRLQGFGTRQQQFVDDASHELRTPLTRMVTDLEVALAHPGQEPAAATLARLLDDATDLRRMLGDLLYLARSSQGALTATGEVDLDDIALRICRELRVDSTRSVDTTGVAPARVIGDERELERAVRNLLNNAERHSRAAIAVSTATIDGWSQVTIDDDGPGVAPADRARIFDRFTRLDEARNRAEGGAGLGLAIVADIARRHGGEVVVGNSPVGGARFCLRLPAAE